MPGSDAIPITTWNGAAFAAADAVVAPWGEEQAVTINATVASTTDPMCALPLIDASSTWARPSGATGLSMG